MQSKKGKLIPAICITSLLLLVLLSFAMVSHFLLTFENDTPQTTINLNTQSNSSSGNNSANGSDGANSNDSSDTSGGTSSFVQANPDSEVGDDTGVWEYEEKVEIFKAQYNNQENKITVKSADGNKIIAPGTSNQYDFYIKNTGDVPLRYTVTTEAILSAIVNGEERTIPLEAKFCDYKGRYVLGTENLFEPMAKLNDLKEVGGLSVNHYTKYSLFWQWPFEGKNIEEDDKFDTILGNLAADGDNLTVTVKITVVTEHDDTAAGGIPQTGDGSNVGIWIAVFVFSSVLLIFALFSSKEDDQKNEAK